LLDTSCYNSVSLVVVSRFVAWIYAQVR
jgi:hypothetical protein